MRTWRRLVGAGVGAALGFAVAVPPATAEEPQAIGWWWPGRPSATFPALFSPVPAVPEGGLYVAGGPNGPAGISALRFELDPEATATTLTLEIADTTAAPVIDACAAAEAWEPAENGGWDQRAEPDCETASVTGTVDLDETEVSFAVFGLQDDGVVDLVLVPGVVAESNQPASFSTAFEPPTDDALLVAEPVNTSSAAGPAQPTPARPPAGPAPRSTPAAPNTTPTPPPAPTAVEAPAEPETARDNFAAPTQPTQPTTFASGLGDEDFAYPAVLALPLVLLTVGSYLAWALTRPVALKRHVERVRP